MQQEEQALIHSSLLLLQKNDDIKLFYEVSIAGKHIHSNIVYTE